VFNKKNLFLFSVRKWCHSIRCCFRDSCTPLQWFASVQQSDLKTLRIFLEDSVLVNNPSRQISYLQTTLLEKIIKCNRVIVSTLALDFTYAGSCLHYSL